MQARLRQQQHDIDGERRESNKGALVGQQRALRRRAAMWAPSPARRFLGGIELDDGAVARSEQDIQRALAHYWRGVFGDDVVKRKPSAEEMMRNLGTHPNGGPMTFQDGIM
eukprot:1657202-Pyramimonas_sp.AAC.1